MLNFVKYKAIMLEVALWLSKKTPQNQETTNPKSQGFGASSWPLSFMSNQHHILQRHELALGKYTHIWNKHPLHERRGYFPLSIQVLGCRFSWEWLLTSRPASSRDLLWLCRVLAPWERAVIHLHRHRIDCPQM